ncbi:MAG TPA: SBBP repeat-containing protein, partial [Candidatus Angelobacter sp.]|nr:SBBP repeat-containing protein [Candidatus Angelobacter sp.]
MRRIVSSLAPGKWTPEHSTLNPATKENKAGQTHITSDRTPGPDRGFQVLPEDAMSKFASFFAVCFVVLSTSGFPTQSQSPGAARTALTFELNQGQTAPEVKYLARSQESVLFFTSQGVTVLVPQIGSFRLQFENISRSAHIIPANQLAAHSNYLHSNPKESIANIPNFSALHYIGVYPGIDVRFYGQGRHLEHDFVLAPAADPSVISLRVEGIDQISMDESGSIALQLGEQTLYESSPAAWQTIGGKRVPVRAGWKILNGERLGIELGRYNSSYPVTIDPVLAYSTHFGGSTGNDITLGTTFPADTTIQAVVLDRVRNIYVAGTTSAADFPTTAGAFNRTPNQVSNFHADTNTQSGFVSKFDPTGRILIYSTFLHSGIPHIAVDSAGHVYTVASGAEHSNGPNFGLDFGIFVDKLSGDGGHLLYTMNFANTVSGAPVDCQTASGLTAPTGIAADNTGHVWVAGSTF